MCHRYPFLNSADGFSRKAFTKTWDRSSTERKKSCWGCETNFTLKRLYSTDAISCRVRRYSSWIFDDGFRIAIRLLTTHQWHSLVSMPLSLLRFRLLVGRMCACLF